MVVCCMSMPFRLAAMPAQRTIRAGQALSRGVWIDGSGVFWQMPVGALNDCSMTVNVLLRSARVHWILAELMPCRGDHCAGRECDGAIHDGDVSALVE